MAKLALPYPIPRNWSPSAAEAIEANFQRLYGSSARLGTSLSITNGLDDLDPSIGDLIACITNAGTYERLAIVSTAQRAIVNTGGVPAWGQIALASGVSGILPLANFYNATVTQRVLGRNSAGGGVIEEVSLSQLLDWISASVAQGDIVYRDAGGWARLPAGTAGQLLSSGGTGANPSWTTAAGGVADNVITQNYFAVWGRPTAVANIGLGNPTTITEAGTHSTVLNYPTGSFLQYIQTGTSLDLKAGLVSPRFDYLEADADPTFEIVLRTGATITQTRIWIGLTDSDLSVDADDQGGTKKYMAFRFSTIGSDAGWIGVCRDGTTQSTTPNPTTTPVAAINASTLYRLKIRKSGSTVFFSVNGGAETSLATNLPAAATPLGFAAYAYNAVAGSTHPWEFSRLRCYYGS